MGATLVNGESNLFLVTRRDNRMLAVVSWHLYDAVFGQGSPSLPAEMGAPPGWFDNFGTVRWGGAGPQSRKQVLEYLLEGFGYMHTALLGSKHLTAMAPLVSRLVIFATALVAGIGVPEPTGPFVPIPGGDGRSRTFLSFNDARTHVHAALAKWPGKNTQKVFFAWVKSGEIPQNIPASPHNFYRTEWTSWFDFVRGEAGGSGKIASYFNKH